MTTTPLDDDDDDDDDDDEDDDDDDVIVDEAVVEASGDAADATLGFPNWIICRKSPNRMPVMRLFAFSCVVSEDEDDDEEDGSCKGDDVARVSAAVAEVNEREAGARIGVLAGTRGSDE